MADSKTGDNRAVPVYLYFDAGDVTSLNPLPVTTASGALSDYQDQVRIGNVEGVTGWTKFGYRSGLTAAAGEETVWATTGNFTPQTAAETYTIAYNNTTDGSGTTGAQLLAIFYIDSTGAEAIAVHTLGSTGSDTTSFSGFGINRVAVQVSGSADTNTNAITFTTTSSALKIAVMAALEGTTNQAIFTTGSNHDGVARFIYINVGKGSGGGSPKVLVKGHVYNRQFDNIYQIFRSIVDTSVESTITINEPIGFNLSPTDVLWFTADTDTNNADVVVRFSLNSLDRAFT